MLNHTGIWVVIPNWNGADYILDCLKSLHAQTQKHIVVVVDNGSVDNSVDLIEKSYPQTVILRNKTNLGFAGGVNVGLKHAIKNGAEYVALFNNDAVADKNWLEYLVKTALANKEAGIITGKFLQSDGNTFDSTGECYSIWGVPSARDRGLADKGQRENEEFVFGATGGASLYRVSALNEVGLFDENYFAYYEDVDISFRAQQAGWRVMYQPKAVAYHKISATSSRLGNFTRYHATKNICLLYFKNMPGYLLLKYLPLFLIKLIMLFGSSLLKGKLHVWLKGFSKFLLLLPRVIRERHNNKRLKKVPTSYIDSLLLRRLQ